LGRREEGKKARERAAWIRGLGFYFANLFLLKPVLQFEFKPEFKPYLERKAFKIFYCFDTFSFRVCFKRKDKGDSLL
jgi:hypothetical protein